jgi:hypothetical protein
METVYTLHYVDGRTIELDSEDDSAAITEALEFIGEEAVLGDWERHSMTDDGYSRKRMLIWESEIEALHDNGCKVAAELIAIG